MFMICSHRDTIRSSPAERPDRGPQGTFVFRPEMTKNGKGELIPAGADELPRAAYRAACD